MPRKTKHRLFSRQYGLTLIQLMLIILVLGIAGKYAVDYIIEHSCRNEPTREFCPANGR